ncbi:exported hypothetical protein [uncultured Defluviicoccus sp.]|uniref:Uncharacterized protein n=1 Tax=metagenome TaxID=256318 RepID=A0A380TB89_9ZZZZ|nr:exported hypothetical protein [uncultured Defluviicoccus sp.]
MARCGCSALGAVPAPVPDPASAPTPLPGIANTAAIANESSHVRANVRPLARRAAALPVAGRSLSGSASVKSVPIPLVPTFTLANPAGRQLLPGAHGPVFPCRHTRARRNRPEPLPNAPEKHSKPRFSPRRTAFIALAHPLLT